MQPCLLTHVLLRAKACIASFRNIDVFLQAEAKMINIQKEDGPQPPQPLVEEKESMSNDDGLVIYWNKHTERNLGMNQVHTD